MTMPSKNIFHKCPQCGAEFVYEADARACECPACKERIPLESRSPVSDTPPATDAGAPGSTVVTTPEPL